jgi:hypothetical protein
MTHSLFERGEAETASWSPGASARILTRLNTSFSIDQDFWLVRMLGLGGGAEERDEAARRERPSDPTSSTWTSATPAAAPWSPDPAAAGWVAWAAPAGGPP